MKRKAIKVSRRKKFTFKTTVTTRPKVRNRRIKQFRVIFVFMLILIVCSFLLFRGGKIISNCVVNAEQFKLRYVEVVSSKNITRSEVLSFLPFREGNSMFKLWIRETKQKILQEKPEIESVKIHRGWRKVIVTWKERTPIGWVLKDGSKIGVDYTNKEFPLRGQWAQIELPQLDAKSISERAEVLEFMKALSHFNKEFFAQGVEFSMLGNKSICFNLKDGTKIYWGTPDSFEIPDKLHKLNKVFADAKSKYKGIEYVDLRFFDQGRILLKPKAVAAVVDSSAISQKRSKKTLKAR
ncbi:MAG: FtsQ-type POTRA domain-containing protein [Endomicrobiales bacterium]|nr:FtsQ-type POTRA domain-containing protein [Endomicrobiales bacterium]